MTKYTFEIELAGQVVAQKSGDEAIEAFRAVVTSRQEAVLGTLPDGSSLRAEISLLDDVAISQDDEAVLEVS